MSRPNVETAESPTADGGGVEEDMLEMMRRAGLRRIIKMPATKLAIFTGALIAIWQIVVELGLIHVLILPSPWATGAQLVEVIENLVSGGYVFDALLITTTEILVGFGIAAVTGVTLGIVAGATTLGREVFMPFIVAINSMPKIAFAPVFVAWLGFGLMSKFVLAAFIAFFPLMVNTAAGVQAYSESQGDLFQSMRATQLQQLRHLQLPTALPYIFAGMKSAAVLCVIGAIVAEFLGGNGRGLGELIRLRSNELSFDVVFALIIVLSIVGLVLFRVIIAVERRVVHWGGPTS